MSEPEHDPRMICKQCGHEGNLSDFSNECAIVIGCPECQSRYCRSTDKQYVSIKST